MPNDAFSLLLSQYMRRIRASASGVAAEIGLSRESVNNWRNGSSLPSPKSRDRLHACARYLRLTESETNQLFAAAGLEPEFPLQGEGADDGATPFAAFIGQLFMQLAQSAPYPITLLLSQAHWGQPPFRQQLLARARAQYGDGATLHIQPPYSVSANSGEYFAAIGRQCGFEGVASDYEFEAAMEQRLTAGERVFCLVSRFEQGTPALREALAGILRSLCDMHSGRLHLLLCGGETLADLKYRSGDLSLLNIARVTHWPDAEVDDLRLLAGQRWPRQAMAQSAVAALCGGHPALFEEGMQWLAEHGASLPQALPDLRLHLANSARLWQTFLPLTHTPASRARLRELLQASDLGRARPYLQDDELRRLFWGNLVHVRGQGEQARLHWRCDIIREAGLAVLA
jgi:transcriptional regulator with XRE-family HTH domain